MSAKVNTAAPRCVPGRKAGPEQRKEALRIWLHIGDDDRKMMQFLTRHLAREQGLVNGRHAADDHRPRVLTSFTAPAFLPPAHAAQPPVNPPWTGSHSVP